MENEQRHAGSMDAKQAKKKKIKMKTIFHNNMQGLRHFQKMVSKRNSIWSLIKKMVMKWI